MGLNVGIEVKQQEEGFMRLGSNPRGTLAEIGESARSFVKARVPAVDAEGCAAYEVYDPVLRDGWYRFDARCFGYGAHLPDDGVAQIIAALAAWACYHFSHEEGVEIRTLWAG